MLGRDLAQEKKPDERIAEADVKPRIIVSFKGVVEQALKLEIGDFVWFHRGSKDGEIVVTKAPEDYQKLMREAKKAKNLKGT